MPIPTVQERVGKAIARLRGAAGYTQEEFAYHFGIDRAYMGRIERGKKNLQLTTLEKIAGYLEIPISKILREAEKG